MYRTLMLSLAVCLAACTDDPSADEFGQSEQPLQSVDGGAPACASPKVLVCHIPPGNPANAHFICVGAPAVKPHQKHHGDGVGGTTCGNGGGTSGSGGGAGTGGSGGGAGTGGAGGGGPACVPANGACQADADCCSGYACSNNTCIPLIL
jgi:Dickkopf N-terminal cysteine-rich region